MRSGRMLAVAAASVSSHRIVFAEQAWRLSRSGRRRRLSFAGFVQQRLRVLLPMRDYRYGLTAREARVFTSSSSEASVDTHTSAPSSGGCREAIRQLRRVICDRTAYAWTTITLPSRTGQGIAPKQAQEAHTTVLQQTPSQRC